MQNMKEIFLNTDLQQKMNFGKRKVHIHSTKKTKKGNMSLFRKQRLMNAYPTSVCRGGAV